jgi:uncharacterized protein (DUF488 family)
MRHSFLCILKNTYFARPLSWHFSNDAGETCFCMPCDFDDCDFLKSTDFNRKLAITENAELLIKAATQRDLTRVKEYDFNMSLPFKYGCYVSTGVVQER